MKRPTTDQSPCWVPPIDISDQAVEKFRDFVNKRAHLKLRNYDMLHNFSIRHRNNFWLLLWEFLDIKCSVRPSKICICWALEGSLAHRIKQLTKTFPLINFQNSFRMLDSTMRKMYYGSVAARLPSRAFPRRKVPPLIFFLGMNLRIERAGPPML